MGDPGLRPVRRLDALRWESSAAFRRGLVFDAATWARARGRALWKALVTLADDKERPGYATDTVYRMGWRHDPRQVIDLVIADHRLARPS